MIQVHVCRITSVAFRIWRVRRLDPEVVFRGSIARPAHSLAYASRRGSPHAAQGSLPRGELLLGQELIDCRCLLIFRTCSLLPVLTGDYRTRSRLTPHRSPKHSLGCGSRTTYRHAPRSTFPHRTAPDLFSLQLSLAKADAPNVERAHASEQRLPLPLAHRAGRRPALGKPGARSAEREDAAAPRRLTLGAPYPR